MTKEQWQFASTVDGFNGARIAREAVEAGAVTLRVEREGRALEFVHKSLVARALRVGLIEIRGRISDVDCIPVLSGGHLTTDPLFGSGWRHVVPGTAQELYQKVKAAEGRRSVTIVDIITEEASECPTAN